MLAVSLRPSASKGFRNGLSLGRFGNALRMNERIPEKPLHAENAKEGQRRADEILGWISPLDVFTKKRVRLRSIEV
jgi:hypothetical protein